jgi:hypothetical protein
MAGLPIIDALDRDIARQTRLILESEFILTVRAGGRRRDEIIVFSTTLTKNEIFKTLVDTDLVSKDDYAVFQYAGSSEPWKLDTLKISYSPTDFEDLSPPLNSKSGSVIKYRVRAMKKAERYTQTTIRTRDFIGGIMENHVFLTPAKKLRFDVQFNKDILEMRGCPPTNEYPINIFITDSERGYIDTGESSKPIVKFYRISESNSPIVNYRFESERQFLPFQGFSFFLDVRGDKVGPAVRQT